MDIVISMISLINALDKIRNESTSKITTKSGFIIGKKWFTGKKAKITKCLITPRITRAVIAQAAQEEIKLVISIHPPTFTRGFEQIVDDAQLDLLKIIIDKKIALYSLGEEWLISEDGGFDYLFDLLDFQYKSQISISFIDRIGKEKALIGRLGERKKKLKLSEFLYLLQQFADQEIRYLGYNELPLQKALILNDITDEEIIHEIDQRKKFDVIIVGEITYEALLTAQLIKLPLVVVGKRNLENMIISKVRRKLMEEVTINLPEIIIKKQDEIGATFST
jgi:putative NIF3 family GTP cyclohydrolase 1 type 2